MGQHKERLLAYLGGFQNLLESLQAGLGTTL